ITNSEVLEGIIIEQDKFSSETLVTHKGTNFTKIIKRTSIINE
ncbi:fructose-bisphosphatase class II, partial [Candidatus Woesearchaeota archaeon]|nr:fructose-bisphosphatase class II [Candidatus Woesearchaeota archaeon]